MFDTWFDQRPHDEDTTSPEEEQILKDFFDEKISASEAARNLTLAVGSEWDPDAAKILGLLLDAAEEIPASHTKLVELLAAIKNLGGMAYKLSYGREAYWIDLPGVEMMMDDTRRSLSSRFGSTYANTEFAKNPQHYGQLSAFAARLTASGVIDLAMWAMQDLYSALEVDHSADLSELDGYVAAAAGWIKEAGKSLAQWPFEISDPNGNLQKSRSLWTEDRTRFAQGRWDFWRERFEVIADLPGASEMARKAAREAVDTMRR